VIIEAAGLKGLKCDLAYLDEVTDKLGFVRWQWEYYRATYDLKFEDKVQQSEYFLRINARVESGKLEKPDTILFLEDAYMGKVTFPHGLDYSATVPNEILNAAKQKLTQLQQQLAI